MTKQKGEGYQGIGAIDEPFEYENTRSDFRLFRISDFSYKYIPGTKGAFSDKVDSDIDGLTDEIM